ncbi:helix-turn-helix domain-containing protein [Bacillus pumilus]|uniref:helix-turn-helix domain-containing protein n=1 Tax=Bacillus pumilus TaxID=1408 RepID=UPI0011A84356|nr:helix-turn-helix domain-containing protein [Bacillus pumilus]
MEYHLKNRQQVEDFMKNEVLTSAEAQKLLNVNRQRLSKLIEEGRILPVKKEGRVTLFIRSDVDLLKVDLEAGRRKYRPYEK